SRARYGVSGQAGMRLSTFRDGSAAERQTVEHELDARQGSERLEAFDGGFDYLGADEIAGQGGDLVAAVGTAHEATTAFDRPPADSCPKARAVSVTAGSPSSSSAIGS